MLDLNKIYCIDCIEGMKQLDDNSIDSIVTDPPYELGFMGKIWDASGIAYNVEMWKEALRVLKPGGFLLSFGGTRTYHRMACAIEDAGFEIRDQIQWIYGCLTEDTEILTPIGWMLYHKTNIVKNSLYPILIYDIKRKIFKWEVPERWQTYNLQQDTCYRIKSDKTDQLVSRNHRCLVEREGKLKFIHAENLKDMENMPILSDDFYQFQKQQSKVLFQEMQRLLQRPRMEEVGQDRKYKIQSSRISEKKRAQRFKESCLERWGDLFQKEGKLWEVQDKVCSLSNRIYSYGEKGWICNGAQIDNGSKTESSFVKNRSSASQRPQSREQQIRELNVIQNKQSSQNLRGYGITKAKITKEEYTGMIFSPTVSTGCFIARRKGKIFITGNSGFPKSLNIGKAVDKLQNIKREIIGYKEPFGREGRNTKPTGQYNSGIGNNFTNEKDLRPIYKNVSEWYGWGTALKPANEPICVARKPISEKTVAENILKFGTGGINIDACRVEVNDQKDFEKNWSKRKAPAGFNGDKTGIYGSGKTNNLKKYKPQGRFPSNVIHDGSEEVMNEFAKDGVSKSSIRKPNGNNLYGGNSLLNSNTLDNTIRGHNDSGSVARFFYCAKASKSERNLGLDQFEKKSTPNYMSGDEYRLDGKKVAQNYNVHPTVKPLKLMKYLVRLVTPKGGVVLDPFMGSGTTGMAAKSEGFKYIGFDMTQEYVDIANARIKEIKYQKKLF